MSIILYKGDIETYPKKYIENFKLIKNLGTLTKTILFYLPKLKKKAFVILNILLTGIYKKWCKHS